MHQQWRSYNRHLKVHLCTSTIVFVLHSSVLTNKRAPTIIVYVAAMNHALFCVCSLKSNWLSAIPALGFLSAAEQVKKQNQMQTRIPRSKTL